MPAKAKYTPSRVPYSAGPWHKCAIMAGDTAIAAPEKSPKKMAKRIVPVASWTASIQNMIIPVARTMRVTKLKIPIFGATNPGSVLPKKLAALSIDVYKAINVSSGVAKFDEDAQRKTPNPYRHHV